MKKVQLKIKLNLFDSEANEKFKDRYEPISLYAEGDDVYQVLFGAFKEIGEILTKNGHKLQAEFSCQPTEEIKARKERKLFMYQHDPDEFE